MERIDYGMRAGSFVADISRRNATSLENLARRNVICQCDVERLSMSLRCKTSWALPSESHAD